MAAAAAALAAFYFGRHELIVAIIAALVIVEMLAQLFTRAKDEDFSEMLPAAAMRVFGVLYVAVLGGYIIAIRVIEKPDPAACGETVDAVFYSRLCRRHGGLLHWARDGAKEARAARQSGQNRGGRDWRACWAMWSPR